MTTTSRPVSAERARLAARTVPPVPRSSFCRMSSTPAPAKERVNSSPQSPTTARVREGFKTRTASRTSAGHRFAENRVEGLGRSRSESGALPSGQDEDDRLRFHDRRVMTLNLLSSQRGSKSASFWARMAKNLSFWMAFFRESRQSSACPEPAADVGNEVMDLAFFGLELKGFFEELQGPFKVPGIDLVHGKVEMVFKRLEVDGLFLGPLRRRWQYRSGPGRPVRCSSAYFSMKALSPAAAFSMSPLWKSFMAWPNTARAFWYSSFFCFCSLTGNSVTNLYPCFLGFIYTISTDLTSEPPLGDLRAVRPH